MFRRKFFKIIGSLATLPAVSSAEAEDSTVTEYSEEEAMEIGEEIKREIVADEDSIYSTRTAPLRVHITCADFPNQTYENARSQSDLSVSIVTRIAHENHPDSFSFVVTRESESLDIVTQQRKIS